MSRRRRLRSDPLLGLADGLGTTRRDAVATSRRVAMGGVDRASTDLDVSTVDLAGAGWRVLVPDQITGTVLDYAPPDIETAGVVVVNLDAGHTMAGISSGYEGRPLVIVNNADAFTLTLKHNGASALIRNRFRCPGAVDFLLGPKASIMLMYADRRWSVVGG